MEWTDKKIKLLGSNDDYRVAEELGVSTSSVQKTRTKLGIPAFDSRKKIYKKQWTNQTIELLGQDHDIVVAQKYEQITGDPISISSIERKRYQLGILSAKESDLTRERIQYLLEFCLKNRIPVALHCLKLCIKEDKVQDCLEKI